MNKYRYAWFLALFLSFLFLSNAYAQSAPPPDGMPPQEQGKPPTPPFSQYEDQLRDTYTELHITNAQQPIWQAYEDKVHALMTDLSILPAPASTADTIPALQKLQHAADVENDRLAALEDIVDAAKALYAALDDKQKVIADRRLASTVPPLNSPENAGIGGTNGAPSRTGGGKHRRGGGGGAPPQ